jgi:hypothetical protein
VPLFSALDAFYLEHERCGDLDSSLDGDRVWVGCTCGAVIIGADREPRSAFSLSLVSIVRWASSEAARRTGSRPERSTITTRTTGRIIMSSNTRLPLGRDDTAIVFIDPQNEVLSEKGAAWGAGSEQSV